LGQNGIGPKWHWAEMALGQNGIGPKRHRAEKALGLNAKMTRRISAPRDTLTDGQTEKQKD
jgi:hypothetical protein